MYFLYLTSCSALQRIYDYWTMSVGNKIFKKMGDVVNVRLSGYGRFLSVNVFKY